MRKFIAYFYDRFLMPKISMAFLFLVIPSMLAFASDPDCTAVDRWPTKMAFVHLKNAGLTDNNRIDFAKTKTVKLASEKIVDNVYRQIHLIRFTEKSARTIEVITVSDASNEECSMSGVDVYLVSQHLGR